ncbi:MAG: (Fe-S)-binding protein [Bacteroidales bacterium]|nr:(Fe-S)-binding protein [Candidatus Cryptobacteroides faecihippi]
MIDRIPSGFNPFVIPFLVGMGFVLLYCAFGVVRILFQLSREDRRKFFISLVNPKTALKNIRDIFCDCLFHVKLWKRNPLLGYMHSSIAFGWFMLILLGHIEVILFVPTRINLFYYPIFFNFFVAETDQTLRGALLFFLMDFFLLVVLSGIVLAIIKRVRSRLFGMRRTAKPSVINLIGLYALWSIFPLRLLAETFTAHISGGSFLTGPANWIFRQFLGNDLHYLPTWWAYSIVLGIFMCVLPFSRYMHIPAEMLLIPMRNAGLKIRNARKGLAKVQVYSCPNCGVCIDACPMSAGKENIKDCTVYLTRQIRRGNEKRIAEISDKCLLCGKCEAVCQVGVQGPEIRIQQRAIREYSINQDYSDIAALPVREAKVLYFSGCMSKLVPSIGRSVESVLRKAGVDVEWMDRDGGLCCGRPMLTAGRTDEAMSMVHKNEEMILASGADTLVVSCPICYRMFKESYNLPGVRVVHYSVYFDELVKAGRLHLTKSDLCYVYHDPCELGRGCGIYEEPRRLVGQAAAIAESDKCRAESVCCGGSLGSLSLSFRQREKITKASLENLYTSKADAIATACPLCQATLSRYSDRPVRDIAEIIDRQTN